MVALKLFRRPSKEQQDEVLAKASKLGLNYDAKCKTKGLDDEEKVKALKADGYRICSKKVRLGEGWSTFRKARSKMNDWRHVKLGWTSVSPDIPIKKGADVCLCANLLGLWIMNPLKTVYVETRRTKAPLLNLVPVLPIGYTSSSFSYGEGTMQGHLLAGEERYSLFMDRKDKSVHYQVSSLSKPDHLLSKVGYPVVCLLQSAFIHQSARSFAREVQKKEEEN